MWVRINGLCKSSLGAPGNATKILHAKNGQKVDEFVPIYLGTYRYWWNMVCDFWLHCNRLSFGYVRLLQLKSIFLVCFFFFSHFFFLPMLPLSNLLTHCIESFSNGKYQGGLLCDWNRVVPGWESSPQSDWTFTLLQLNKPNFRNE